MLRHHRLRQLLNLFTLRREDVTVTALSPNSSSGAEGDTDMRIPKATHSCKRRPIGPR
jgi:hypothetical protein